ncbi:sperm flagellar protein 1-like [Teleopsis dalmanni]|uniref:sperm flagellar protein 1-like n=1 Tax=Teleopsis dalmanni TaxID=139649 RepID=UPI0018CE989E|nr:sperm flagellar protein 1-like [Teleopsis dalmanni]
MNSRNAKRGCDSKHVSKNVSQYDDLLEWLKNHKIPTEKLNKIFSDAVLMAKLLKDIVPKLVDIHNYSGCHGYQSKLANWETINNKVFSKLNMKLSKSKLEQLAKCETGKIEVLLTKVMTFEKELLSNVKKSILEESSSIDEKSISEKSIGNAEINVINTEEVEASTVEVPKKMISYAEYEECVKELARNLKELTVSEKKIQSLENLVKIKQEHIDELTKTLYLLSNS